MPGLDAERVISALRPPSRTFIDTGGPPTIVPAGSTLRLSLSNRTALDLPIGEIVAEAVAARIRLRPRSRTALVAVVQEAVLNAVLHGNLEMGNEGRCHSAGTWEWEQEIERRLADPLVHARRCEVRVRWSATVILLRITDQGVGFEPVAVQDDALPWGRGLRIIAALALRSRWTRGGRTLIVRLAR